MSETQVLLGKIAALRQRLEQAQALAGKARNQGIAALDEGTVGLARLWSLQQRLESSQEHALQLDQAIKTALPPDHSETPRPLPAQLTTRARKLLERGRTLLAELRGLANHEGLQEPGAPLSAIYREATTLTETALRMAQLLPDRASGQFAVCDGMEVLLNGVADRIAALHDGLTQQQSQLARIQQLASLLLAVEAGKTRDPQPFVTLAETLLEEAAIGVPLRFFDAPPYQPNDPTWRARYVACHGLTVAQVVARLVRQTPELRGRHVEAVMAALLHDVGMLQVPAELLTRTTPLDDSARRSIESHALKGAAILKRMMPEASWLHEAAASHHERGDGTGYPEGSRKQQLSVLTRLLAVCDVYAASCAARPTRAPRDTRTALTDVLLLAEKGALDRDLAEKLLDLSFYPTGSVVELADGSIGVVVATPTGRREQANPARPVVAQLTNPDSGFLAAPRFLDLAQCEGPSIIRSLSSTERRSILHTRYPQWA